MTDRPFEKEAAGLHEALVWAVSYRLVPETQPALRPHSFAGAPTPQELPVEILALLREAVADVPIDVQARIRDVLWEAKRDPQAARQAILDYMDAAEHLGEATPAGEIARRVARAFGISRMMRADEGELAKRAMNFVEDATRNTAARVLVASKLAERAVDGLQRIVGPIEQIAQQLTPPEAGGFDWDWHRRIWEIVAILHEALGDLEKRDQARLARARTFEQQARWLKEKGAGAMLVADRLETGIRELLQLGRRADADALRGELSEAQRQQVDEMIPISSGTVDLMDSAQRARAEVAGKPWRDAILKLVSLVPSPSKTELRASALQTREEFPILFLSGLQTVDEKGRTIASEGGEQELLRRDMVENANNCAEFAALGTIEPARHQILFEHNPGIAEWMHLLQEGPVSRDRLRSWAFGLDAGLRGDWIVATHLILPQIENLLREILEAHGHSITSFREEGIEIGNAFGGLVRHPGLSGILSEDMIFDMESYLVDRAGRNLRNLIAHGQLPDGVFHAKYCAYIWHLGLRLALLPVLIRELRERSLTKEASGESSQEP